MARRRVAHTGYSRLVRLMKVLLPVAALVTVGAIFMVGRSTDTGESLLSAEDMATLGAGLRLEEPRFTGRTAAGEPYRVTARWAAPDSALPRRIRLDRPTGEIALAGGRQVTGSADSGLLLRRRDRLTLTGDVRLNTDRGQTFTSDRLSVNFAERTATSPRAVTVTGPEGRLEAGRMEIERSADGAGRILFSGGVRVVFIPEASR